MSEPVEMTVERAAAQSAQAILLARVFATVVTLALLFTGLILCSAAPRFGAMFAELGAEAPVISSTVTRHGGAVMVALLALAAVTMFFIWAKGKAAAWMAGLGLLMIAIFVPILIFALLSPVTRIISEMGNM